MSEEDADVARVDAAPAGVSVKCYTYESKNRATMGFATVQPPPA